MPGGPVLRQPPPEDCRAFPSSFEVFERYLHPTSLPEKLGLDLSTVAVGDEIGQFLIQAEIGQPQTFILDFRAIVTATAAGSVDCTYAC
jgi:hypothetical protein